MKKIKELQKRSQLDEGRDFGIGFTILERVDKGEYKTYLPFTACKDYLNDFAYCEAMKKTIGKVHGYDHKLLNCFDNVKHFFMGVNTLHHNHNGQWDKFEKCKELLISNRKNLQTFLNKIEKDLGLRQKTMVWLDEDVLYLKSDIYWLRSTALISVYTLLIRCFFNITEEELKLDLKDVLKDHKAFIDADSFMIKPCLQFFEKALIDKDRFANIDYAKYNISESYNVHNFGISTFLGKIANEK